jgi:hypothetical protein
MPYWRTEARQAAAAQVIDRAARTSGEGQGGSLTLRSMNEVTDYDIQASDGQIGRLTDLIADDASWVIRYMVVDTGEWLRNKKVLVSPSWADTVAWPERNVYVGLSRETVKDSPEFDPSVPVNQEYELRLYDYYGRPTYWTRVGSQPTG